MSKNGGDMFNIWESFMRQNELNTHTCEHFWVAIDKSKQVVVGHIGVIMSTYGEKDKFIYHTKDINPSNVCELVRMGVREDYRGKHIGRRLFDTLEEFAIKKGMKQIVLSTLDKRELACRFYEGVGFKMVYKTMLNLEGVLGSGDWEVLYVVHYIKLMNNHDL